MFVTTLGMDNFYCSKINACCMGRAHSQVEACIASPTSPHYVVTALFHTQPTVQLICILEHSTNDILCILVKAHPNTHSTGPQSPTKLGLWLQDLGLPNDTVLTTVAFLLHASRHKLAFTSRHYPLLTATDTTPLY